MMLICDIVLLHNDDVSGDGRCFCCDFTFCSP